MLYKYKDKIVFFDSKFLTENEDELLHAPVEDFEGFFGEKFTEKEDVNQIILRVNFSNLNTDADKIKYNISVGIDLITLFRQDFKQTKLKNITSLEIFSKLNSIIILILTGSFKEAADLLEIIEPDEFLTEERIQKYVNCLRISDALDY